MKTTILGVALIGFSAFTAADTTYSVTITNITKGQTFTPQLVTIHSSQVQLFRLGEPASEALAVLAEDGSTAALVEQLQLAGVPENSIATIPGLLGPGASISTNLTVKNRGRENRYLSVAAMLIPTNDTFFALNQQLLPNRGSETYMVPAYDAGSEANDQNCANIPGPRCGGAGSSPGANAGNEGFVHIGNGFHDLGSVGENGAEVLTPFTYDWRNPVARITVEVVH